MKIKAVVFTLALMASPLTALAGGGHDHGHGHSHGDVQASVDITQNQAETVADLRVDILVNKRKIDKSWKSVKVASAEKKMNGHQSEWVITYKNEKVEDSAKSTLYIFLSSTGDYIAANFTGK